MKKIIKIVLIAIVFIGIVSAITYFFGGISNSKEEIITSTDFEKHIKERVYNEIKGKEYVEATSGFSGVNSEINTEGSITLADGSYNLSSEEQVKCRKIAFYAYAPIFVEYATAYFKKSSWNDEINGLRAKAQNLLNVGIAEEGTDVSKKLYWTINTVNNYYGAWKVVNSANYCTSAAGVERVKVNVRKYKKRPFTNNASLLSGLNNAYNNAKSAYARYIISCCSHVANSYANYDSYPHFYSAYDQAVSLISDYTNKYGGKGLFSSVKSQLNSADQNAMGYYDN